ncbi:DinB family protein [Catalinimonas niigatensis]|uniref:DinB family protein n=1 Tax=Catalinimonas niigatensis TaxID=1397264 RepID=UPI0026670061|nr:DinB family protein [Catalinimonas niigatensis]WPP53424.1 DinB family protein [Catalinimonas niigatensis]
MENSSVQTKEITSNVVITPEALLEQWQGHRRLTRRVIEAFPEEKLFNFSVGDMRPFSALAMEMIGMAAPGVRGIVTGKWENYEELDAEFKKIAPKTKEALLKLWDESTDEIDRLWPQIPPHRFQEVDLAFGMWEGPVYWTLFYFIDNEIHHRGQGYVYLRALGITPPPFWER